jgi:hypothetical protein
LFGKVDAIIWIKNLVVLGRLQLHASLDDIDRAESAVSDGAANATGQGGIDVVLEIVDNRFL